MSETTRCRVKTLKTVLESAHLELFEKRKILKIGQVVVILVHCEVLVLYSDTEYDDVAPFEFSLLQFFSSIFKIFR